MTKQTLFIITLYSAFAATAADSQLQSLKKFSTSDSTIAKDVTTTDEKAWLIDCPKPRTVRLFELSDPGVERCMVVYRARLKSEGLDGQAYLEMWCHFPGKGEFFSRGLESPLTGSNDWAYFETPFFLKKGEKPDLIKLNLVIKGTGKVWIKDVELQKAPLPRQ